MKRHPYEETADRELAKWGAQVVDRKCGPRNHVQDIRRVLRGIDERNPTT